MPKRSGFSSSPFKANLPLSFFNWLSDANRRYEQHMDEAAALAVRIVLLRWLYYILTDIVQSKE